MAITIHLQTLFTVFHGSRLIKQQAEENNGKTEMPPRSCSVATSQTSGNVNTSGSYKNVYM